MQEVKLLPLILIAILVGVILGFAAAQPFAWYNDRLQAENEALKAQVQDLVLCTLQSVECDFERSAITQ